MATTSCHWTNSQGHQVHEQVCRSVLCTQSRQTSCVMGGQSIQALSRGLHWGSKGAVYQHDLRHVDVLVKKKTKRTTQRLKTPDSLESDLLSRYRSQVTRCLFLSQDRANITFTVYELCRRMSKPTQQSLVKLKRLVGYVKGERQG